MDYEIRELWLGEPGRRIYGKLYLPLGVERPRLLIYAHEIACTHARARVFAERLAPLGLAVFAPDFRGGGDHCKSDGRTEDMTVLGEVEDLETVFDAALGWDFADGSRPALIGASQGGFVSAIYAGRHPERVSVLTLLYPAYGIPDEMRRYSASVTHIPEKCKYDDMFWIGRRYITEMLDYDPYGEAVAYPGPVLIMRGHEDKLIPLGYSKRARALFADCELRVFPSAGHLFKGADLERAAEMTEEFLRRKGFIS